MIFFLKNREKEEIVDADDTIATEKEEKDEVPSSEVNKAGTVNEEEKEEDEVCISVQIPEKILRYAIQ